MYCNLTIGILLCVLSFVSFGPAYLLQVSLGEESQKINSAAGKESGQSSCCAAKEPNDLLGWRVGPTAWSFHKYCFFEAVDKTAALSMHYIESFDWQKVSKDSNDIMSYKMPDEVRERVRSKLKSAGVILTSHYIGKFPDDEAGCRQVFEFGRKMGIKAFVCEPEPEQLDMIEKFCKEYEIALAIHNHPEGKSRYWDPQEVLKVCQNRSKWIGACVDTGHWMRSGILPVEALKMLKGRIVSLHLKDLNEFGDINAYDVPWGTGKGDIEAVLRELHRQGVKPVLFGIEYESNLENSMPDIAQCGGFFHTVVEKLFQEAHKDA